MRDSPTRSSPMFSLDVGESLSSNCSMCATVCVCRGVCVCERERESHCCLINCVFTVCEDFSLSLSVCVSVVIVYFDLFLIPCKGGEE